MADHANLVFMSGARESAQRNEGRALVNENPGPADGWYGADAGKNLRNLKAGINPTEELCERLAAAARERGRPLTPEEIELVGRGEPLPAIVPVERPKTVEQRFAELEAMVANVAKKKR